MIVWNGFEASLLLLLFLLFPGCVGMHASVSSAQIDSRMVLSCVLIRFSVLLCSARSPTFVSAPPSLPFRFIHGGFRSLIETQSRHHCLWWLLKALWAS